MSPSQKQSQAATLSRSTVPATGAWTSQLDRHDTAQKVNRSPIFEPDELSHGLDQQLAGQLMDSPWSQLVAAGRSMWRRVRRAEEAHHDILRQMTLLRGEALRAADTVSVADIRLREGAEAERTAKFALIAEIAQNETLSQQLADAQHRDADLSLRLSGLSQQLEEEQKQRAQLQLELTACQACSITC